MIQTGMAGRQTMHCRGGCAKVKDYERRLWPKNGQRKFLSTCFLVIRAHEARPAWCVLCRNIARAAM